MMECVKCGKQLRDDANFCRYCGNPVQPKVEKEEEVKSVDLNEDVILEETKVIDPIDTTSVIENNNESEVKVVIETINEEKIENITPSIVTSTESSKKIKEILAEMSPVEEETENNIEKVLEENSNTNDDDNIEVDEPTARIPAELIRKYSKDGILPKNIQEEPTIEIKKEEQVNDEVDLEQKQEVVSEEKTVEESAPEKEIIEEEKVTISTSSEVKTDTLLNEVTKLEEVEVVKVDESKEQLPEEPKVIVEEIKEEKNIDEKPVVETQIEEPKEEVKKEEIKLEEKIDIKPEENKVETKEEIKDEEPPTKKKGHTGVILLTILLLLAIGTIAYLVLNLSSSRNELSKVDTENIKLQEEVDKLKTVSTNVSTPVDAVMFNGYEIKLLENSEFSLSNESLIMKTSNSTISTMINSDIEYTSIKYSKDTYRRLLIDAGYKVNSYGTKVVDTKEYVVYEVSDKQNKNYLIAYTMLADKDVIAFIISTANNDINYDVLEETNKIVSTAKEDNLYSSNDVDLFGNNSND